MPLGISERVIKESVSPVDLSGVYKVIQNKFDKEEAELKQQRRLDEKELYTYSAHLDKLKDGARANDLPDIISDFNKFKHIKKQLLASPKIREQDPEFFYKKDAEADEFYNSAMTKIQQSKDATRKIKQISDLYITGKNPFDEDLFENGDVAGWVTKLSDKTTSELLASGDLDVESKLYKGPDFAKIDKTEGEVFNAGKWMTNVEVHNKDGQFGTKLAYIGKAPQFDILTNSANSFISRIGKTTTQQEKAAKAILFAKKDEYDEIYNKWSSIKDEDLARYKTIDGKDIYPVTINSVTGVKSRKPQLIISAENPIATLRSLTIMKKAVEGFAAPLNKRTEFNPDGKNAEYMRKALFSNALSMQSFKQKMAIREKALEARGIKEAGKVSKFVGLLSTALVSGKKDVVESALAAVDNGYNNSLLVAKGTSPSNIRAFTALSSKLSGSRRNSKYSVAALQKLDAKELASVIRANVGAAMGDKQGDFVGGSWAGGATEADLSKGVLISSDKADENIVKIFSNSPSGQKELESTMINIFGSKEKTANLSMEGDVLIRDLDEALGGTYTTPKATPKVTPKATPKVTPKATPKATPKGPTKKPTKSPDKATPEASEFDY